MAESLASAVSDVLTSAGEAKDFSAFVGGFTGNVGAGLRVSVDDRAGLGGFLMNS